MLGRRITMGSLLKEKHEEITKEGFLETIYISEGGNAEPMERLKDYHKMDRSCFVHPGRYENNSPDAYLVKILPKLGLESIPKVYDVTKI